MPYDVTRDKVAKAKLATVLFILEPPTGVQDLTPQPYGESAIEENGHNEDFTSPRAFGQQVRGLHLA
jgi:hypothetical protein